MRLILHTAASTSWHRVEPVSGDRKALLRTCARDGGFESFSLQQRVSLSAASAFEGREPLSMGYVDFYTFLIPLYGRGDRSV
jgi:hypothetical protein